MSPSRRNDLRGPLLPAIDIETPAHGWSLQPQELKAFQSFRGAAIAVRIDAVTQLHDGLLRLMEFALRSEIGLSLEIPPFTAHISGHQIEDLVGSAQGLEIGQQGLATGSSGTELHVSAQSCAEETAARPFQIEALRFGKRHLEQQFGSFFSGSYSAADDRVPMWIAQGWEELQGRFISFVANRPKGGRLRTVKLSTRFWDLEQNCCRGRQTIVADLLQSMAQLGYAGLVLHADQLHSVETVKAIQTFFKSLQTVGLKLVHPSAQARFQAETIAYSPYRDYRGGVIPNA